jgi:hypothetical protein
VTESIQLLRLLIRIRRRIRVLAAMEGAVVGATVALGTLALARGVTHARGAALPWSLACACLLLSALLGAGILGARRIALARCARLVDLTLDGRDHRQDRVLSALFFLDGPPGVLARAAIGDAVVRARALSPSVIAPAHRPRALPALGAAALALLMVGIWPAASPGARHGGGAEPTAAARAARLRVPAPELDAERDEVRAAATAAQAADDETLVALADEMRTALQALTDGRLTRDDALDRLQELAARAGRAAREAEREGEALHAAGRAMESTPATHAAGKALGDDDRAATEGAWRALAERAAAAGAGERAALASALAAAGSAAAQAAADQTGAPAAGDPQRRLNRDHPAADPGTVGGSAATPGERRLERLRRDLDDTARACRGGAEGCGQRVGDRARELPRLQREAQEAGARRRLENAAKQLRERLRRGELGERAPGQNEKRFLRAARGAPEGDRTGTSERQGQASGEPSDETAALATDEPGMADGEGGGETLADETEQAGTSAGGQGTSGGAEAQAQGQGAGIGQQPGGDPLGPGAASPTRGREREAHLRGGAGPTRSEVIEAAAQRGFASGGYGRVFGDYQAVVEESLTSGAVPEGKRYLVRRYFQLIRPRTAPPARADAPRRP